MTEVPDRVKAVLALRSSGCEGCGRAGPVDPHHRQPRGMGGVHGEAADWSNDPVNFLLLCRFPCHDFTEHEPDQARRIGWVVPHPIDVTTIPARIFTPQGFGWWRLRYLGDEGPHVFEWVDPDEAAWIIDTMYGQG